MDENHDAHYRLEKILSILSILTNFLGEEQHAHKTGSIHHGDVTGGMWGKRR
jgi:hypothetical protein